MKLTFKTWLLAAALAAPLLPLAAHGQSAEDLRKGASDTENVLNYGMDYGQKRYSPLDQINKETVKYLVPVWNYSLGDDRSQESQAFVHNGVVYITTHNATMAIDAKTGKQKWKTKVEYPPETPRIVCCGIINRGVALYDGKVFRTTLDAHILALEAKTGKELWKSKVIDWKDGYSQTLAPLIADGVLIAGTSGGEYGIRGFIDGWDPATGKASLAHLYDPGAGGAGQRDLARRHLEAWRGIDLDYRFLRSGAETGLLGHRECGTVERDDARWGRQPVHRVGPRAGSEDRRHQVALPVLAERSVRLRRRGGHGSRR